jgi:hypothetical protein
MTKRKNVVEITVLECLPSWRACETRGDSDDTIPLTRIKSLGHKCDDSHMAFFSFFSSSYPEDEYIYPVDETFWLLFLRQATRRLAC